VRLQPIVYTTQTGPLADWYGTVLGTAPAYASDVWTTFGVGDASLAVHRVDELPPGGRIEMSLVATEPLEDLVARLDTAGVGIERGIQDETFGRSILLRDPDGNPVQVNEHSVF
jgi:catechol-2,3-dioxygenase